MFLPFTPTCYSAPRCLPCLYGSNVSKVTGGSCCCNAVIYAFLNAYIGLGACCVAGPNRTLLRKKYDLAEDDCGDCMAHFLCLRCAGCTQLDRRMPGTRGLDRHLPWETSAASECTDAHVSGWLMHIGLPCSATAQCHRAAGCR